MNVASNQAAALLETVALRMRERELQAKAESQERLLKTVLKQLPCGVIIANPSSEILLTNSQAMELFKQSPSHVGGRTLLDSPDGSFRADSRPNEPKQWLLARAVLNGEAVKDEEFEHVLSDGERRHIVANSAPVRNDRGEIIAGVVALQDVTELRETQQRLLLKSEEKYRDLVDLSPDAIFIVDSEGNYVSANPAGLELLQCTALELTGMPVSHTYLPEERGALRSKLEEIIKTGTVVRFERTFLRRDGTILSVEVSASPMRDGYFQTVVRDISERKRSEAALAKAFKEIETLKDRLQTENIALREEIDKASMFEEIVGNSPALQTVLSRLSKVAPTDSGVLITGETGTGKELIARAIHRRSQRSSRVFVSVNCAAIPRDLIASELFGHEKGAFTGATQQRLGRFELANGGTIFLDEVGELPAETQIALLRVLQEHEFERIGGTRSIQTDARVIAATNRDLEAAIAAGTFRSDLFYRLNVFPIEIPPLRERKKDIPLLVEYFIDRYARKAGKSIRGISKKSLDLLQTYPWPGNIRELQHVIERSLIVSSGDVFSIDESWLSKEWSQPASRVQSSRLSESEPLGEREIIEAALVESRGRVSGPSGAAAKLKIPPSTLESKIKALKIRKSQFKFG
jgi:PAS domain S-box-containing protein